MTCLPLAAPGNGIIECSVEDDEDPSYEDTCNFTCNSGYQLTGSDTRTCQSDGSWSGSTSTCTRGVSSICKALIMYDKALVLV